MRSATEREDSVNNRNEEGRTADDEAERWCALAGIQLRQLKRWREQPARGDGTRLPVSLSTAFAMARKYVFERLLASLPADHAADPLGRQHRDRGGGLYELLLESLPTQARSTAKNAKETSERFITVLEHLRTGTGSAPSEATLDELEAFFEAIRKRGNAKRYADFTTASAPAPSHGSDE